jgi:hypothetical protein
MFSVETHLKLCYNLRTSRCELRIVKSVVALAGVRAQCARPGLRVRHWLAAIPNEAGVCPQKEVVEAPDAYALA